MSAGAHLASALKRLKQRRCSEEQKCKKEIPKFENSEKQVAAVLQRGTVNIQFVPP